MFDLRTEIREPGTGKVIATQHYVRRVDREHGEMFERPPGSGDWVYANGTAVPKEKLPKHLLPVKPEAKVTETKVEPKKDSIAAPKT